jgi:threonine synthase
VTTWKSTRSGAQASLVEALFQGPAADGGLFVPSRPPSFDAGRIARESRSFQETALRMAVGLLGEDVPEQVLGDVVADALDFDVPLVPIGDDVSVLELFHGPTFAFKDVGARFMAALMERLDPEPERTRVVLVATSGDTGGAVADAFAGRERFQVVVLFPRGGVTDEQRRIFSTLGGNVTAVEMPGSFDDCQTLVKAAFRDPSCARFGLIAANSINVGRLVPQSFYYVDAVRQGGWKDGCAFSVPSGNLGNLTGGMIAAQAGLPVRRFVSSLNVNDTLLRHLETGNAEARPARRTLSSAMDVSLPNNLERMRSLTGDVLPRLRELVWARSFDDAATQACMKRVLEERGYMFDPHGAVGMLGAEAYRRETGDTGPMVVLATAHPAKLPDAVEDATGRRPDMPPGMRTVLEREERVVSLPAELPVLLDLLDQVTGRQVGARG